MLPPNRLFDRARALAAPVIIVPYDPGWPHQFGRERVLLARVFRGSSAVFEHVGSTAVPGLGGKPIIDIMVGVTRLQEAELRIADLEEHDYEYVPEYEAQMPERRYFRKPREGLRTYHLHCVVEGRSFWRLHLAFRDYLRVHPEAASSYLALKQQLALQHRTNRVAYTEGKSSFVASILEKAGAEGAA